MLYLTRIRSQKVWVVYVYYRFIFEQCGFTLSKIHYERRKTEQVTLKANFIQFWSVESEFIIKNYFLAWTSELACILAFIWKSGLFFGYFWDLQYWPHLVTLLKCSENEGVYAKCPFVYLEMISLWLNFWCDSRI